MGDAKGDAGVESGGGVSVRTSFQTKEGAFASRRWFLLDAQGQVVGRLASKIASVLRGKCSPAYTPHVDCGGFVVVVNADKIRFTGKKMSDKSYYHHTGYVGGIREVKASKLAEEKPCEILRKAVWGMIPKGPLGRAQLAKLKVYAGGEHPHAAQQPILL